MFLYYNDHDVICFFQGGLGEPGAPGLKGVRVSN